MELDTLFMYIYPITVQKYNKFMNNTTLFL